LEIKEPEHLEKTELEKDLNLEIVPSINLEMAFENKIKLSWIPDKDEGFNFLSIFFF